MEHFSTSNSYSEDIEDFYQEELHEEFSSRHEILLDALLEASRRRKKQRSFVVKYSRLASNTICR